MRLGTDARLVRKGRLDFVCFPFLFGPTSKIGAVLELEDMGQLMDKNVVILAELEPGRQEYCRSGGDGIDLSLICILWTERYFIDQLRLG